MKKKLVRLLLLVMFVFSISFSASAQIYVKIRPVIPVVVRTERPGPEHVWVNEEWEPNNGAYRYSGGHWEAPPHPGYRYREGHWKHNGRRGDKWVRGNWRR